jgi:DNA helicase-2/ATP-dependent DNA helicase PcrA
VLDKEVKAMNLHEMYAALDQIPDRNIELSDEQMQAIEHSTGPLWIIAGPGSGKTEVLVLRCLKLLCVDSVQPAAIMITTFTEKGARNLQDRLAIYKEHLEAFDPTLASIDLSRLWVGTLHSLCNDIMQKYRYPQYQNVRLLDDLEQLLFIYDYSILAGSQPPDEHLDLWVHFDYLVNRWNPISGGRWNPSSGYRPSRWMRARASVPLFNRIVEDIVNVEELEAAGGIWSILANAYCQYRDALIDNYRCDFAHLQERFLDFLGSPYASKFLHGDGTQEHPGLSYVLVDEYQDTNPIQEAIYLTLAQAAPHNLGVVGDDDQALYRFRGGTVECMVTFAQACSHAWGVDADSIQPIPLVDNFRSHPRVVSWCDEYIRSFALMHQPGARSPGKPSLGASSSIVGDYPSVALIRGNTWADVAGRFADTVVGLVQQNIVQGPERCALLLKSVRETARWAGQYADALRARGLSVYNPRSRTFLEQEEVQAALGALVEILDPDGNAQGAVHGQGIQQMVDEWRGCYSQTSLHNPQLSAYVEASRNRIAQIAPNELILQAGTTGPTTMAATLQEVFYHILSFEPFVTWQANLEQTLRLGRLTKVMETYSSIPSPLTGGPTRGYLRTSSTAAGQVSFQWRTNFYYSLVGLLVSEQLNDPEDEEVICPPGRVPIMTVYQAKGLEFPFVFVAGLDLSEDPDSTHLLEDDLAQFRHSPPLVQFSAEERALQDLVRFFYVAYSRAQYALILLATNAHIRNQRPAFGGHGRSWFMNQVTTL